MTPSEIIREKILVEIIAERDAMIINLVQEIEKLKAEIKEAEKLKLQIKEKGGIN